MKFYYENGVLPCKAVMFFLSTINLQPERVRLDLRTGENLTPEFLKINPQHTLPVVTEDNGFALSESRAILVYLAEKYAEDTTYYPSDPKTRAIVNQRLMFDIGTLFQALYNLYVVPLMTGDNSNTVANTAALNDALAYLEDIIGDSPFMAGEKLTIADFAIVAHYSFLVTVSGAIIMKFYYENGPIPCKAVMLLLSAINLQPEMVRLDLAAEEHFTPELLRANPQHTTPTITEDNGFALSESRTILIYLAEKYAPDKNYYPSDPEARALVNHRLLFDLERMFPAFVNLFLVPLTTGDYSNVEKNKVRLNDALALLETIMGDSPFLAGDHITVADFSFAAEFTALGNVFDYSTSDFPKLNAWIERFKSEVKDFDEIDQEQSGYLMKFHNGTLAHPCPHLGKFNVH